eukprot:6214478-Pleurochrysis_carterae.AAC.2
MSSLVVSQPASGGDQGGGHRGAGEAQQGRGAARRPSLSRALFSPPVSSLLLLWPPSPLRDCVLSLLLTSGVARVLTRTHVRTPRTHVHAHAPTRTKSSLANRTPPRQVHARIRRCRFHTCAADDNEEESFEHGRKEKRRCHSALGTPPIEATRIILSTPFVSFCLQTGFNYFLIGLGAFLAVVGAATTLAGAGGH